MVKFNSLEFILDGTGQFVELESLRDVVQQVTKVTSPTSAIFSQRDKRIDITTTTHDISKRLCRQVTLTCSSSTVNARYGFTIKANGNFDFFNNEPLFGITFKVDLK